MVNRKESKGFVQLEWVCPNCNGRNPGPVKTCNSCGAPQPENVQFQRAADEKIITDEKIAAIANAGADIHCGFCGTRNPATATTCSQCGGDLKEGKARQAGQILQAAPTPPKTVICTNCGTENPGSERTCKQCGSPLPRASVSSAQNPVQAQASQLQSGIQKKKINWVLFGGIGAFLLVCCIAAVFFLFVLPTKSVNGTVANVQWQTSVPVQEIQAVNYSNERGDPPSDAYNLSCHTEDQEVCEDKTIDKGNGYAEVVKECHTDTEKYCNYTMDEWTTIQTYDLNGNDLNPTYADPTVNSGQRLGSTSEDFTVTFSTPSGQETYSPGSVSEFQEFQVGSTWTLKMNALGSVISVEK